MRGTLRQSGDFERQAELLTPEPEARPTITRGEERKQVGAALPPFKAEPEDGPGLELAGATYEELRRSGRNFGAATAETLVMALPDAARVSPEAQRFIAECAAAEVRAFHDPESGKSLPGETDPATFRRLLEGLMALIVFARSVRGAGPERDWKLQTAAKALGHRGIDRMHVPTADEVARAAPSREPSRKALVLWTPDDPLHGDAAARDAARLEGLGFATESREASVAAAAMGALMAARGPLAAGDELVVKIIARESEAGAFLEFGHTRLPMGALEDLIAAGRAGAYGVGVSGAGLRERTRMSPPSGAGEDEVDELPAHTLGPEDPPELLELIGAAEMLRHGRSDLLRRGRLSSGPRAPVESVTEEEAISVLRSANVTKWIAPRGDLPPWERIGAAWRGLDGLIQHARKNVGAGLDAMSGIGDADSDAMTARIVGSTQAHQVAADHESFTAAMLEGSPDAMDPEATAATFNHTKGGIGFEQNAKVVRRGERSAKGSKYALVIGNGERYSGSGVLFGAPRDAMEVAARYRSQGFEVDHQAELTAPAMAQAIRSWGRESQPEQHRAFYFAGHGNTRGLVGVDHETVPNAVLSTAVSEVRSRPAEATVVVDACHSGAAVGDIEATLKVRPLLPRLARGPNDGPATGRLIALAEEARELHTSIQAQAKAAGVSPVELDLDWDDSHIDKLLTRLAADGVKTADLRGSLARRLRPGESPVALWDERARGLELVFQKVQQRLEELRAEDAKARWLQTGAV